MIRVLFFGQLTEFTNTNEMTFDELRDTDELIGQLNQKYPSFSSIRYSMAIDKKLIKENTMLHPDATIALLPPFSGG